MEKMNSVPISCTMFLIFMFLLIKNAVGFDDYNTDVGRILEEIKNEDLFIPHDKTWKDICEKPPQHVDLCEGHPYERLEACLRIAQRLDTEGGGFDFNFRYIGDEIKCEQLSITGLDHSMRPMFLCPNANIQRDDGRTIRLPLFYVFQSCYGDKLYVLNPTGDYKTAQVAGEWTEFEVKRWHPETPQPPKSKWLLYSYDVYTGSVEPDSVIETNGHRIY